MVDSESKSLQLALTRLRAELSGAGSLDEKARTELHAALARIESRLAEKDAAATTTAAPHGLDGLAVAFETDHPALSASLRQFIELLGQAGL